MYLDDSVPLSPKLAQVFTMDTSDFWSANSRIRVPNSRKKQIKFVTFALRNEIAGGRDKAALSRPTNQPTNQTNWLTNQPNDHHHNHRKRQSNPLTFWWDVVGWCYRFYIMGAKSILFTYLSLLGSHVSRPPKISPARPRKNSKISNHLAHDEWELPKILRSLIDQSVEVVAFVPPPRNILFRSKQKKEKKN